MCFPNTLLHQSSVYLMKARMQSYASCGVDSGETASIVHLHRNLLHAHTIMIIEEFGPFIAISFLLSCSDTLMNLNATQYLGCFSVVFVGLYCFLQQHSVSRLSVNNFFLLQTAKAWCSMHNILFCNTGSLLQAIISATGNSQVESTCSLPSSNPHCSFMSWKYMRFWQKGACWKILLALSKNTYIHR